MSGASMPNFGAKVISSWPLPYSVFLRWWMGTVVHQARASASGPQTTPSAKRHREDIHPHGLHVPFHVVAEIDGFA